MNLDYSTKRVNGWGEAAMIESKAYLMDCMIGMKDTPDKFYDLSIVDPPYGIGIGGKVGGANRSGITIGGKGLSRPKATGDLMTRKSPQKNTSRNYKESV